MPSDDFEALLERCRERLSEINLSVPDLESGAPRQSAFAYSLGPPPARPKPPAPPPAMIPPPPAAMAPAPAVLPPSRPESAASIPPAAPAASSPARHAPEEREQDEVFPPLTVRPRPAPVSLRSTQFGPANERPEPASEPASERPARGRAATASIAAAIAAAGAAGIWLARRPSAAVDIPLDGADAMAVQQDKRGILVAEGKELVGYSLDGRLLSRKPLDAPVDSLRWEQGSLWSTDGRTETVAEHQGGGRTTVFPLNHVPGSLYVKDKYLWTAEKNGSAIHQFLITRSILGAFLQPLDSFELTGLAPETFAIDDAGGLWLADAPTRRLYRLRAENGAYAPVAWAPLSPFVGPLGKLRGLTLESDSIWIMSQPPDGRGALRRIPLRLLDWTPS